MHKLNFKTRCLILCCLCSLLNSVALANAVKSTPSTTSKFGINEARSKTNENFPQVTFEELTPNNHSAYFPNTTAIQKTALTQESQKENSSQSTSPNQTQKAVHPSKSRPSQRASKRLTGKNKKPNNLSHTDTKRVKPHAKRTHKNNEHLNLHHTEHHKHRKNHKASKKHPIK